MDVLNKYTEPDADLVDLCDTDTLLIVPGDVTVLRAVLGAYDAADSTPSIKLLLHDETRVAIKQDFLLASTLTEYEEAGVLEIRQVNTTTTPIIANDEAAAVVFVTDDWTTLPIENDVDALHDGFMHHWNDGDTVSFRQPSLSSVSEVFTATFSQDRTDEFLAFLTEFYPAVATIDTVNHIDIALLFAAAHELMFYDLTQWAELSGYGSSSTFSRKRRRLEEAGVIQSENVQVDIGRPRMRVIEEAAAPSIRTPSEIKAHVITAGDSPTSTDDANEVTTDDASNAGGEQGKDSAVGASDTEGNEKGGPGDTSSSDSEKQGEEKKPVTEWADE